MLPFHTLDVFTTTPFAGNPLAVVMDANGLTPAQMLTVAREFNLSETIFVRTPADPAHTAEVRIFFPTGEIPFAGHPTIGCAILLAEMDKGWGNWTTVITLEEQAGLVPVSVTRADGVTRAELTAPVIPHAWRGALPKELCARALGIAEADIGPHAPSTWGGGPAFAYIPVNSLAALATARPTEPHWSEFTKLAETNSAYLYAPAADTDYQARMFSPGDGIAEDPATGSATAILAAQLWNAGGLEAGTTRLWLAQGVEMGRESHLELTIDVGPMGLTAVRVAGSAVRISEGRVAVPSA